MNPTNYTATDSLDSVTAHAQATASHAADQLSHAANDLAEQGRQAMQLSARQLRDQALQARTAVRGYIEGEPLKAVLIAMAAGAAMVLLGGLMTRGRRSD